MLYFILQFFLLVFLFIFYIHCKWRRSFIYYWTFIFLLFVMQGRFFFFLNAYVMYFYLCKKIRGDFNFFKLIWLTKDWPIAHWPGTKSETKRHRWVRFRGVLRLKQRSSKWDGGRERERRVFCTDELWLWVLCFLRRSTLSDPCNLRRNRSRSYLLPEIGKGSQLKWL